MRSWSRQFQVLVALVFFFGMQGGVALSEGQPVSQYVLWGENGKWTIFVNTAVGNGCFIERLTEDETQIRLGYLPERLGGFISVANPDWSELKAGVTQDIALFFDGSTFAGETEFFEEGDYFGGFSFFNNPNFLTDFAKHKNLMIVGPEGDKTVVDLTGTSRAIIAMNGCQETQ